MADAAPREGGLRVVLPADLTAPFLARDRMDAWLDGLGWPAGPRDDLVLAVSEAVSNSVEHGYGVLDGGAGHPGTVDVRADVVEDGRERRVVLRVRDEGTWRPQPPTRDNRRYGLPLMRACAEDLTVDGTAQGTTLVLRSLPVPA